MNFRASVADLENARQGVGFDLGPKTRQCLHSGGYDDYGGDSYYHSSTGAHMFKC